MYNYVLKEFACESTAPLIDKARDEDVSTYPGGPHTRHTESLILMRTRPVMLAHCCSVMLVQYYLVVTAQYYPSMLIQFCQAGAQLSGYDNILYIPEVTYENLLSIREFTQDLYKRIYSIGGGILDLL